MQVNDLVKELEFALDRWIVSHYLYFETINPIYRTIPGVHQQMLLDGRNVYYVDIPFLISVLLNQSCPHSEFVTAYYRKDRSFHIEVKNQIPF